MNPVFVNGVALGYAVGVTLGILACIDGVMQATEDRFNSRWEALKWILLSPWKKEAQRDD